MISINPRTIFAVFAFGAFASIGLSSLNSVLNAFASSRDAYAFPSRSMASSLFLIAVAVELSVVVVASPSASLAKTTARSDAISSSVATSLSVSIARGIVVERRAARWRDLRFGSFARRAWARSTPGRDVDVTTNEWMPANGDRSCRCRACRCLTTWAAWC